MFMTAENVNATKNLVRNKKKFKGNMKRKNSVNNRPWTNTIDNKKLSDKLKNNVERNMKNASPPNRKCTKKCIEFTQKNKRASNN